MKLPPHNQDAERAILSACIASPNDHAEVRDVLNVDDYYLDAHQRVWRALCEMRDRKKFIDFVTLTEELKARGDLDDVGGVVYIAELIGFGNHAYLAHYAEIVRDTSVARSIGHIASEAQRDALAHSEPVSELLERTQQCLAKLAGKMLGNAEANQAADVVNIVLDQIDRRSRGERPALTPTGFAELDSLLAGGLRCGHLVILAARPSVGKTSLAANVARHVCDRGESVLFVSLEQSKEELITRLMANVSGIAGTIINGNPNNTQAKQISEAAEVVRRWQLQIEERSGMTASQITAAARLAKRRNNGLGLLVVDYINEVHAEWQRSKKREPNRNEELGDICRRLRECARMLGVPCLLLAQLNRMAADEKEAPQLHHLRDSGEIEQIADVVCMLHREERGNSGKCERIRLYVRKQRNGALGSVAFDHDSPRYRFIESGIE